MRTPQLTTLPPWAPPCHVAALPEHFPGGQDEIYPAFDITKFENAFQAQYRVRAADGAGLVFKKARVSFVHVPSYHPGWIFEGTSAATPGCYTSIAAMLYHSIEFPVCTFDSYLMWDFGLTWNLMRSQSFFLYPTEPYVTMALSPTDANGYGNFSLLVREGHPGLYGLVFEIDGLRTSPLFFFANSSLATIEIVTEPSR
eukprot:5185807-Prymnesium_polylepis.2